MYNYFVDTVLVNSVACHKIHTHIKTQKTPEKLAHQAKSSVFIYLTKTIASRGARCSYNTLLSSRLSPPHVPSASQEYCHPQTGISHSAPAGYRYHPRNAHYACCHRCNAHYTPSPFHRLCYVL